MDDDPTKKIKADLAKSRHCAKALLRRAEINAGPIDINLLVPFIKEDFDIQIVGVPDSMFNGKADAITQRRGNNYFILFNKERPSVRIRFSLAHELGHLYVGHLHESSSNDLNTENYDEIEANAFAAELLIPTLFLKQDIEKGQKNPDELAVKYKVSSDAMWFQILKSGLTKRL